MEKQKTGIEFPHFGASYPDDPCPFCNTEEYIEWCVDEDFTKEMAEKHIEYLNKKYN
ncbi:hypothetical protein [Chryseobacterium aquifrigidense]|uniref:Uncharacterized protein n=1 Tax=Chryseobacterium aquifrigidense TaxID=558021 RepID=A0A543E9P6_9FLAO|nr:hypothetical protein [Chryseobacterium aquifrigidense]TQM18312.1 hypothetical protein FB551_4093 [Chryseobacterium aquifrigidense]